MGGGLGISARGGAFDSEVIRVPLARRIDVVGEKVDVSEPIMMKACPDFDDLFIRTIGVKIVVRSERSAGGLELHALFLAPLELGLPRPHQLGELLLDDLRELLPRIDALDHLHPEGGLPDPLLEVRLHSTAPCGSSFVINTWDPAEGDGCPR